MGREMNLVKSFLLAGAAGLVLAASAQAADLPTMKGAAPPPPPGPIVCTGIWDFFTTPCTLSVAGVTLYGTIDIGGGWQKFGAPWNPNLNFATNYLISKAGHSNIWLPAPNALSQSNVGVKFKEDIGYGWSVVGLLETGFDPYSLELANGPYALAQNSALKLPNQNSSGDSARAGQWNNSQSFIGFSNTSYGTLTYGRQNTLLLDAVNAYDPMGGSYAFSLIGFSGTTAGGGNTEDTRSNTAFKYRVNIGNFRLAGLAQVGGYAQGNGATGIYQGQVGFDLYGFSFDFLGGYASDSMKLSTFNAVPSLTAAPPDAPPYPLDSLKLTISNDTSFMAVGKYKWNQLTLFAGYEWLQFANPSSDIGSTKGNIITSLGGFPGVNQGDAFYTDEILQVVWTGAKYSFLPTLDGTVAYYHYNQGFYQSAAKFIPSCSTSAHSNCSGTLDAVSGLLDWHFSPKFDAYVGMMWSEVNGGQASGYQTGGHVNLDPTVGVRFKF